LNKSFEVVETGLYNYCFINYLNVRAELISFQLKGCPFFSLANRWAGNLLGESVLVTFEAIDLLEGDNVPSLLMNIRL
jgi:hypothetical protein